MPAPSGGIGFALNLLRIPLISGCGKKSHPTRRQAIVDGNGSHRNAELPRLSPKHGRGGAAHRYLLAVPGVRTSSPLALTYPLVEEFRAVLDPGPD